MKKQYLLTIEFRYLSVPIFDDGTKHHNKTITIGVCDTLDEVIKLGNEQLDILAQKFNITDKFEKNHLFGQPRTLVTNCCTKDKIQFFAKITTLVYDDIMNVVDNVMNDYQKYIEYEKKKNK